MLAGRDAELARIRDLLDGTTVAGAIVLVGAPGSGKSALLEAVSSGRSDVVSITGRSDEASVSWGAVRALVDHLGDAVADLPEREQAILGSLADQDLPPPPAPVVAAAVAALVSFAAAPSLLVAVDDAWWVDGWSRRALSVAAMVGSGLRLLATARSRLEASMLFGPATTVDLAPLGLDAAATLVRRGLSADDLTTVVSYTGGNPAALLDIADDPRVAPATGDLPVDGPGPGPRIRRHVQRHVEALPPGSRLALVLEALQPSPPEQRTELWVSAGIEPDALVPAAMAGLVGGPGGAEAFDTALLRDAVLADASPSALRRAHEVLLARAQSQAPPSASGAGETDREAQQRFLVREAQRLRDLGDLVAAARAFERAAASEPDEQSRWHLVTAAGLAAVEGGLAEGESLLRSVVEGGADPDLTASALLTLARVAAWRGRVRDSSDVAVSAEGSPVAGPAHLMAAAVAWSTGDQDAFLRHAVWSDETSRAPVGQALQAHATLVGLAREVMQGQGGSPEWSRRLDDASRRARADLDAELGTPAAMILLYLGRVPDAADILQLSLAQARSTSALPTISWVQAARAILATRRGDPAGAVACAVESLGLSSFAGPLAEVVSHAAAAAAHSWLGDLASVESHARAALIPAAPEPNQAMVHAARGRVHAAAGRLSEAAEAYVTATQLLEGRDVMLAPWTGFLGDAVVGLARAGRASVAERVHDRLVTLVRDTGLDRMVFEESLARLSLGTDAEIDDAAASAKEHVAPEDRAGQFAVHLTYGERLRRARRPIDARHELLRAGAIGHELGLRDLTSVAARELEAAGGQADQVDERPRFADLTPQERAVCEHAATGASTRDIAAAMFLSPKTVETHLGRAYRKLGVRNRSQLTSLMTDRGVDPGPARS